MSVVQLVSQLVLGVCWHIAGERIALYRGAVGIAPSRQIEHGPGYELSDEAAMQRPPGDEGRVVAVLGAPVHARNSLYPVGRKLSFAGSRSITFLTLAIVGGH